jgi:hypothetical protein
LRSALTQQPAAFTLCHALHPAQFMPRIMH